MPSTIEQTKEAILKHGGRASKHQIARELKVSSDYAGLILGELKRKGEIAFSDGFYVLRGRIGPKNHQNWEKRGNPDVNEDGVVNEKDLLLVMANKILSPYSQTGDCNNDKTVK